jgi:hypothetical protein
MLSKQRAAGSFLAAILLIISNARTVRADHGPGTSGGGLGTVSGETMPEGKFAIELRCDETEFQRLSRAQLERRIFDAAPGGFDTLDRSVLTTLSLSYAVLDDLSVSLSLGYYLAVGGHTGSFDPTTGETIARVAPDGLTDLWINAKFRFYHGPVGSLAVYAGVKLPTGRWDVKDSTGDQVDPSATSGSGSFDGMLGFAFSRYLTKRLAMDASAAYTFRTEHEHFKVGDRIDLGYALSCRINESALDFPVFAIFGETNFRYIFKSSDHGDLDPNTGGTALFVALGGRCAFADFIAVSLAAQVPVFQEPNGEQLETLVKFSAAVTASF